MAIENEVQILYYNAKCPKGHEGNIVYNPNPAGSHAFYSCAVCGAVIPSATAVAGPGIMFSSEPAQAYAVRNSALEDAQRFQGDMALWLQGLAMCCQMVANGATHTEKNARMRGLVEMIESALSKVREYDYRLDHFNRNSYRPDHLFVNDYPVRHWKERADNAERELKELKDRLTLAPKAQPEGANGTESETDFKF